MKKQLCLLLVAVCLIATQVSAQNRGNRVPYKLFNDFETGELFGWEAYPYAQDIAFDALYFAVKTPTYNNSKYALARPLKSHDTGELYQGFTKRLNMYTTADTRVKAKIYFQSDRNPESLELSLGTFDGRRYFHKVDKPVANTWLELDIPISSFTQGVQPLKADEHIQVITIEGTYDVKNYLYTYTILMDNFELNGERDRMFTASAPASTSFDMFDVSILNKHFFYGDNISLSAAPEGDGALKQVKGTLVDSKGKVVRDNISFTRSGNNWENNAIYKLSSSDARGQWEIRLKGQNDQGAEVSQTFRFLVPGKKVDGHPRLFFSAEELKNRLATDKSPVSKKILDNALAKTDFMKVDVDAIKQGVDRTAENLVGGPYSQNSVGFNNYGEWYNPNTALGRVIEAGSMRYAFTGDKAAGEQAKKALLKLCSFTKWNADWMLERKFYTYYPVGYTIKPVAYGYDMLYDLMTEQERAFVREAIMEKGLKMFQRDMVEMNRMPSNQTNHIAVIVAGMGLAATAIYGDDPSNPYLEPYLSGLLTKTKTFIDRTYYPDGSYGEPTGYMDMATKDIVESLAAIERNFGVDYTTTTSVPSFYKYPIRAMDFKNQIHSYGDGGRTYGGFTSDHAWWVVKRTGNPYIYNYVKPYWEAGNGGYLAYLWFRDDIKPVSRETLPLSTVYSAKGMVMRSGWDDASTIITTRVGPNSNHYHYDQGTFQIMKNGEELLTDPGIGALGYYANLEFLSYDVQAIAHNVMLVDHDAESQAPAHYDNGIKALRDWPTMTHAFNGKGTDAIESDLTGVYKNKLDKYTRTLLYNKTGPIFLFDQVKSKTGGHVYDWLFHAPQNEDHTRTIDYKDNRMTVDRPNARLTMDVLSTDVLSGTSTIRDRADKKFAESFLTLVSKPNLEQANFFAVILPEAKPANGAFGARPVTTRVDADGWVGAKVAHSAGSDVGFFRTGSGSGSPAGFTTDASRFTASYDQSGKLTQAYFEGSSFAGNGVSVKAGSKVTGAVSMGAAGTDVEVQSDQATNVSVSVNTKPSSVSVNGKAVKGWTYNAGTKNLDIKVQSGKSDISIRK